MRALAAIAGILAVFFIILLMLGDIRHSLAYWTLLSLMALPVIAWKGRALWWWSLAFGGVAFGLAAGPIDFMLQPGPIGVRVLPVMYGIACEKGYACYGCIVPPNPPRYAVLVSF